jgi:hypothetical protein
MERQHKAFCLVHAFNMALVEPGICVWQLSSSHIESLKSNLNSRIYNQENALQHLYTKGMGN